MSMRRGLAGFALRGVQLEASVVQSVWEARKECGASREPPSIPSSRKKAVKSKGLLMDSSCVRPSEMAPSMPWAKRGLRGCLVVPLFCSGTVLAEEDPKSARENQQDNRQVKKVSP